MNRKLFKAILLISLFLGNIDSQAASCPGNQIINPANPNECYCANKANAVCGSNKTYNDFFVAVNAKISLKLILLALEIFPLMTILVIVNAG